MTDTERVPTQAALAAQDLHSNGWSPLPLPARSKASPPNGYTGYRGKYATQADIDLWDWTGNIALRMPPDVVGVDVDAYHGGTLGPLEAQYGELPKTVWSTSRDDGSGIALFRVPNGTTLRTNPAAGIDMIQAHHRYMVVWPSIHPEGRQYQWIDEQSGEHLDGPPAPEDLPDLPWAWIEALTVDKTEAANSATPQQAQTFITEHTERVQPGSKTGVETRLNNADGSRHDTLVSVSCWAMREAAAGLYSATEVIDIIHIWWVRVMDDPERRDGGEFGACIMWAIAQANSEPERVAEIRAQVGAPTAPANINPETGEITKTTATTSLPDEFWNARPTLQHIRQGAHSRLASADATLLAVLARVVTLVPANVTLPATIGGQVSLNLFCSVVDPSGGGKTASVSVARKLVPIDRDDIVDPILPSSGEGLIEAFMGNVDEEQPDGKNIKVRRQVMNAGFAYVDEGQGLLAQSDRAGNTIMETIRSAWMGGDLGQHNASEDRKRWLKEHKYRLCMVVGFQLAFAAHLIGDGEGGTPQRFTFALGTDPGVRDGEPWPGRLNLQPWPITAPQDIDVAESINAGIRERRLGRSRGEVIVDPLDTHADLRRLKLAAALGALENRLSITETDWELAGAIDDMSCAVRTMAIQRDRVASAVTRKQATMLAVEKEEMMERAVIERTIRRVSRNVARKVWRDGPMTPADAYRVVSSRDKDYAEQGDAIAVGVAQKWLTIDGELVARGADDPR